MSTKAAYATPMFHVEDVTRSIRFYEQLGFETIDTEGDSDCPGWARLHCEGGAIMLLAAEEPVNPSTAGVLLYMYTPDLAGLRERLLATGMTVSEIRYPEYMASGEVHVRDPDSYTVLIGHWGEREHEAWERRIEAKRSGSSS